MKKLILGMMLVMVFVSFSKDRDNCVDRHDFDELKLRAEAAYMLDNVFDDKRSLSDDSDNDRVDYFDDLVFNNKRSLSNDRNRGVDRHDFDGLKLRTEASYNKEELRRKRRVMLSNIFDN